MNQFLLAALGATGLQLRIRLGIGGVHFHVLMFGLISFRRHNRHGYGCAGVGIVSGFARLDNGNEIGQLRGSLGIWIRLVGHDGSYLKGR